MSGIRPDSPGFLVLSGVARSPGFENFMTGEDFFNFNFNFI
jgi:hypothetical protein